MDFYERCDVWFYGLTADRQREACQVAGLIPEWLKISLLEAGIVLVPAEVKVDDEMRQGFLLPTALSIFLSQPDARPELVAPPAGS